MSEDEINKKLAFLAKCIIDLEKRINFGKVDKGFTQEDADGLNYLASRWED